MRQELEAARREADLRMDEARRIYLQQLQLEVCGIGQTDATHLVEPEKSWVIRDASAMWFLGRLIGLRPEKVQHCIGF